MDHWLSAPLDLSKCSPGERGRQAVHAVASGRRGAERGNGPGKELIISGSHGLSQAR
jgi:hypothetical protein